jgi:transcriptional regulator with XRE-family HTH domain
VISAKRVKKGISQRDLSRRLGIYEMAIMEFERGHRGLQVSELIDIAAILEEDPVKLLQEALGTPSE